MNKPSRPVLSVRNLHRSYPSGGGILRVMAGADIDIYPGEMVGLIGPSGSGNLHCFMRRAYWKRQMKAKSLLMVGSV